MGFRGNFTSEDFSLNPNKIPTFFIKRIEKFVNANSLFTKHGNPGEDNTLSLGSQMAMENGAPAILAILLIRRLYPLHE